MSDRIMHSSSFGEHLSMREIAAVEDGRPHASLRSLLLCAAGAWAAIFAAFAPFAAAAQQGRPPADFDRFFERADINNDGAITKAELISSRKEMAKKLDRNGDGALSNADAPKFRRARSKYEKRMSEISKHFDVDHNGVVTTDEFVNGPTDVFDRVDANGDGVVTQAEIDAAKAAYEESTWN